MSRYEVVFEHGGYHRKIVLPENRGICDIQAGFWLDINFKWCVASEVRWFILPSMIKSVCKLSPEEL